MDVMKISQGGQVSTDFSRESSNLQKVEMNLNSTPDVTEKKIEPTEENIKKAANKLNRFLEDEHIKVQYKIHDKLNDVMIKIINEDTKEVIMEIPPEKILNMVAKMCEMAGILLDKRA